MAHFFSLAYHGLDRNTELHVPTWDGYFTVSGRLQSSFSFFLSCREYIQS